MSFFLNYQKGKCTQQSIGVNKFGGMPQKIAKFLKLPSPERFTGHAFRRMSATLLSDAGADLTIIKCHGGWKSDQVVEGYIEDSIQNKKRICNNITKNIHIETESTNNPSKSPICKENLSN